jgi:hypothetical protein
VTATLSLKKPKKKRGFSSSSSSKKHPANVKDYLRAGVPSEWHNSQKQKFMEHCNRSRILNATATGLKMEELLQLLDWCRTETHRRSEKYAKKSEKKNRKKKHKRKRRSRSDLPQEVSLPGLLFNGMRRDELGDEDAEELGQQQGDHELTFEGVLMGGLNSERLRGMHKMGLSPDARGRILTELWLSKNGLDYFPRQLCQPKGFEMNLTRLDLSSNNIEHLPASIRWLQALESFDLSNNRLVCLPKEIGELNSLRFLGLANNRIRYLPFQILALGPNLLQVTLEDNPWFQAAQLTSIDDCLREERRQQLENSTYGSSSSHDRASSNTSYSLSDPSPRTLSRPQRPPCPSLMQLCVAAVRKHDICWEAYGDLLPVDVQLLLLAGVRTCDKCKRELDPSSRLQISLIHFNKTAFGTQHPLPFLYSICSPECSRFILIASCILEFLRKSLPS